MGTYDPLRYLNAAQVDDAMQRAGYFDNKIAAVNYVGRQLPDGSGFVEGILPDNATGAYVYELCFYDDNIGRLALGYVYITQHSDGLHAEPGVKTADLTDTERDGMDALEKTT